jgi:hypothetical protein
VLLVAVSFAEGSGGVGTGGDGGEGAGVLGSGFEMSLPFELELLATVSFSDGLVSDDS